MSAQRRFTDCLKRNQVGLVPWNSQRHLFQKRAIMDGGQDDCIMLDDPRRPCYGSTDTTMVSSIRKRSRSGANNNVTSESRDLTLVQTSPASIVVNDGAPKWGAREIFFNDHSKLRDMLEVISEMSEVGLIASVSVNLREASRRYMHYCLLNRPLRNGMVRSSSHIVDTSLAKLPIVPSLVPKSPPSFSCNWDEMLMREELRYDVPPRGYLVVGRQPSI